MSVDIFLNVALTFCKKKDGHIAPATLLQAICISQIFKTLSLTTAIKNCRNLCAVIAEDLPLILIYSLAANIYLGLYVFNRMQKHVVLC